MIITATNIATGAVSTWKAPTSAEAIEHSKRTHGRQYDPVERKTVEGGEPMVWEKVSP